MKEKGGEGSREGGVCPFLVGETSAHKLMRMVQWRRKQDDGAGVVGDEGSNQPPGIRD